MRVTHQQLPALSHCRAHRTAYRLYYWSSVRLSYRFALWSAVVFSNSPSGCCSVLPVSSAITYTQPYCPTNFSGFSSCAAEHIADSYANGTNAKHNDTDLYANSYTDLCTNSYADLCTNSYADLCTNSYADLYTNSYANSYTDGTNW